MLFMNEYEIEDSLLRFGSEETPNLLKGAKVLDGLRRWANSNSDGWAYWQKPLLAAKKLMTLLQAADRFDPTDCTDAELRAALTPIKSFLTKQGVEHHVVGIGEAPPAPPAAALPIIESAADIRSALRAALLRAGYTSEDINEIDGILANLTAATPRDRVTEHVTRRPPRPTNVIDLDGSENQQHDRP